jgi:hypothetical protein
MPTVPRRFAQLKKSFPSDTAMPLTYAVPKDAKCGESLCGNQLLDEPGAKKTSQGSEQPSVFGVILLQYSYAFNNLQAAIGRKHGQSIDDHPCFSLCPVTSDGRRRHRINKLTSQPTICADITL